MADLRWILLSIGIAVIAGVYFYTRRYGNRSNAAAVRRRKDPVFNDSFHADTEHAETDDVQACSDNMDDRDTAADDVSRVDETAYTPEPDLGKEEKIVAIHVQAYEGQWFDGHDVMRLARMHDLLIAGGDERGFFEYESDEGRSAVLFYVADMKQPGTFEWSSMEAAAISGLSFFARLPNVLPAPELFARMYHCADRFAQELGGVLLDDHRSALTVQTRQYIEEELKTFQARCEKAGE